MSITTWLSRLSWVVGLAVLTACGGGGGSPGTSVGNGSSGSSGSGTSASPAYPKLVAGLQSMAGDATNSIDATGYTLLKVSLKDPSGAAITNQVISVSADSTKLSFPDGSAALTDSQGIATVKIARASLLVTGAGDITVNYDYKPGMIASYSGGATTPSAASLLSTYVGYQIATANITLDAVNIGSGSLAAYGTRQVSVLARINGLAATATPVIVSFSASCGQISPATATTDSTGTVMVTYSATDPTGTSPSTLGCSGKTVQITGSSSGAAAVTSSLTVTSAPATSVSFVSASPSRIYLSNSGGASQSLLTFQLLNQLGEGIQNQAVQLSLRSLTGGVPKAAFDTLGGVSPVILTTDGNGKVTQAVYAGSVPTNVVVNAALVSNSTIQTDSAVLAIASGRPVQSRLSMTLEKWAIEGFDVDGATSIVTLNLSDRQGNPVPDGTAVNFVTEGGVMIPPSCVTGAVPGDSRCSVAIRAQGTRPVLQGTPPISGLVTIMAYAHGEEDFEDANGNNTFDCGERFDDLPLARRDDRWDSTTLDVVGSPFSVRSPFYFLTLHPYQTGEFSVPRAAASNSCGTGVAPTASAGDGVWGAADVRKQQVIVFSTSGALITSPSVTPTVLSYQVADRNGNSMPTGTTVGVTVADNTPDNKLTCAVASGVAGTVSNSLLPMSANAFFTGCAAGDVFIVTVTSPLGTVSSNSFVVP